MIIRSIYIREYFGKQHGSIHHVCDGGEYGYGVHYSKKNNSWTLCQDYETFDIKFCPFCGDKLEINDDTIVVEKITKHIHYPYKDVQRERENEKRQKEQKVNTYMSWLESREQLYNALNNIELSGLQLMTTGIMGMNPEHMKECIESIDKDIEDAKSWLDLPAPIDVSKKECSCNPKCGECGETRSS